MTCLVRPHHAATASRSYLDPSPFSLALTDLQSLMEQHKKAFPHAKFTSG